MKKQTLTYLLLCFVSSIWSQNSLDNGVVYKNAKITLDNFIVLSVQDLSIRKDSISFFEPLRSEFSSIHLSKVNAVWSKQGNYFGRGALIGGGFMLSVSLSAINQVELDRDLELRKDADQTVLLFVFGGSVVGGIIGSFFPKWKAVELENKNYTMSFYPNNFSINRDGFSIGLAIKVD